MIVPHTSILFICFDNNMYVFKIYISRLNQISGYNCTGYPWFAIRQSCLMTQHNHGTCGSQT